MSYTKIKETVDWCLEPSITYSDCHELMNFMLYLAQKIRPRHLIEGCPGGDPNYVWGAILDNAYKDYTNGVPATTVDSRQSKIDNIVKNIKTINKDKNLDKIDDYIGKYVVKEYEEWIASTKKMGT